MSVPDTPIDVNQNNAKVVRVSNEEDGPWYVAKDICEFLVHSNSRKAVSRLKESEKRQVFVQTNGGKQKVVAINVQGIQRLLLTSRSTHVREVSSMLRINIDEMSAPFKEQVALRVIQTAFKHVPQTREFSVGRFRIDLYFPTIRLAVECDERDHKHYDPKREENRENFIRNRIDCEFLRFNPDDKGFNVGNVINEIMQLIYKAPSDPKSEAYDVLLSGNNAQTIAQVAKSFGTGRNRLFTLLRQRRVLMQNNLPYQEYLERGYFRVREVPTTQGNRIVNVTQTLVTAKGIDFLRKLLVEAELKMSM